MARRRRRRVRATHSSLAASDPFDAESYGGGGIPWLWIGAAAAAFVLLKPKSRAVAGFEEEIAAQGIAGMGW